MIRIPPSLRWLLLLAAVLACLPARAGADLLAPRSGKSVRGAIVTQTASEVVFNIYWSRNPGVTNPDHLPRFPLSKVKKVEPAPHPEVEVFRRLKKAGADDATALVEIGEYARSEKLKGHARMCFALALCKDPEDKAALKGIGGRAKWQSVRKGNPRLDPEVQALLDRYIGIDDAEERVKLHRTLKERGFKAKPHELERYRRASHQPTGYQEDRPIAYRSDVRPGAVYTLFVPKQYTPSRPWPLIIGLHGGGADGKRGDEVVGSGPSAMNFYRRHAERFGFIVACPTALQAGWGNKPNEDYVRDLITELRLLYHIDIDRIYMTGHSMGGFGTWALGPRLAEDLAAISPMAGAGSGVGRLASTRTPIFIYHSDNDYVGVGSDRAAAKQLLDTDLDFVYTELPGMGHGFPPSIQVELFEFFEPRRRYEKGHKQTWPRSSFLGKVSKPERLYLGDPLQDVKGMTPDLKTWLGHLKLGGGRALAAVARLAEQKPDGAVAGVAKVLGNAQVPFDGRMYAARTLGLLGDAAALSSLRKATALPATKEQSRVAQSAAAALMKLQDAEALPALGKALEAWTIYYKSKVSGKGMRFSDWQRSTSVLADLLEAWATLATPASKAKVLERIVVERVLARQHEVATSERVPQDPSRTRVAMAEAIAKAYKQTAASDAAWEALLAALGNDPKAQSAVSSLRP